MNLLKDLVSLVNHILKLPNRSRKLKSIEVFFTSPDTTIETSTLRICNPNHKVIIVLIRTRNTIVVTYKKYRQLKSFIKKGQRLFCMHQIILYFRVYCSYIAL